MVQAGVDKSYKTQFRRSVASTKTVIKGNSILTVKKHANWNLNPNTFDFFYYKPSAATLASTYEELKRRKLRLF